MRNAMRGNGPCAQSAVIYFVQFQLSRSCSEAIPVSASQPHHQPNASVCAIVAAYRFLREYWLRVVAISAVVLIPCFWHRHLEAGDLASHVYNAWLAQLITSGQAPGLFLAHQRNNVLFDFAVSGLGHLVGLEAAGKIGAAGAVLIFFWGAFALACSISQATSLKSAPWFLAPCLAVLAYGYTFEMGFMNFYLSIGFAFFGLAILARRDSGAAGTFLRDAIVFLVLIPLIWLAHPLGLCVLASAGAYIVVAKLLSPAHQVYLLGAAVLMLLALHVSIEIAQKGLEENGTRGMAAPSFALKANGADQLLLYAPHYLIPAYLFVFLFLAYLLIEAVQEWRIPRWRQSYLLPVQLCILAVVAVGLIPAIIPIPRRFGTMGALGFVTDRLTSVVAIFACCLLAQIKPRKWHYAGFAALAAIFFSYLYSDTATISGMEDQVAQLVASLPRGERVIKKTIHLPKNRISINHIVDRACIGQCFSYDNYEPSSAQFRVRVQSENPFVLSTGEKVDEVHDGRYVVQQVDLPISAIYQCVPGRTALCIAELKVGQENGSIDATRASQ